MSHRGYRAFRGVPCRKEEEILILRQWIYEYVPAWKAEHGSIPGTFLWLYRARERRLERLEKALLEKEALNPNPNQDPDGERCYADSDSDYFVGGEYRRGRTIGPVLWDCEGGGEDTSIDPDGCDDADATGRTSADLEHMVDVDGDDVDMLAEIKQYLEIDEC